jgi:hypothetical protein
MLHRQLLRLGETKDYRFSTKVLVRHKANGFKTSFGELVYGVARRGQTAVSKQPILIDGDFDIIKKYYKNISRRGSKRIFLFMIIETKDLSETDLIENQLCLSSR